jgi:hypothetical protein
MARCGYFPAIIEIHNPPLKKRTPRNCPLMK